MRLRIDTDMKMITVEAVEDFKQLDAIAVGSGPLISAAEELTRVDGDHLWINIASLRRLCGQQPDSWYLNFDKMIAYAATRNWVEAGDGSVRIHIVAAP